LPNPTGINQYTSIDKYTPTPKEEALLAVICNPNSLGKTVTEICSEAGVDRGVYYDAIKKEGFFELRNKITMDIIRANVSDVLLATAKFAINNAKNNADRKMILEMAGLYTNKQDINLNSTVVSLTDAEIDAKLANLLDKIEKSE
jgi:hypothetical protein